MIMLPSEAGIETKYSNTTWLTIKNDYAALAITQELDFRRTGARHLFDYCPTYSRTNTIKGSINLNSDTQLLTLNVGSVILIESVYAFSIDNELLAKVSEKIMRELKTALYLQQSKELKELWTKRFNLKEKVENKQSVSIENLKIV